MALLITTNRLARCVAGAVLLATISGPVSSRLAATSHAASGFQDQGIVTLASSGSAADLDPANNELEYSATVERNIDETLLNFAGSSTTTFVPNLATSYSSNADKSVWTFHLQHGVRFHTGRCCMTADDVRYSLGRSVAAQLGGSYMLGRFLTAKDPFSMIKVIDPYTVQFNLGQPTPVFPAVAAQDFNSFILDSKAIKAHVTKSDPYAHNWVTNHDIGTGPYTIQSWQPGQQITLVRYPDYWAGWSGKHFSKAIITTVPVASTRRELVEKGNADLAFDLTPQDVDALRANNKLRVTSPYASEIFYITMTQTGPLASPLARQALSYAVPYDAIIHGIYHDQAKRSYGPLPAAIEGYDPNTFHYQTDFAKAKALLQKAGVPQGTSLTYAYDSGAFPQDVVGNVLVAASSQIGITLKLEGLSTTGFNNAAYGTESPSARPNLIGNTWWPDYNDPYDMADTLIDSKQSPPNGNNLGLYHDSKADAALALMNTSNISQILKGSKTLQDITGRQDPPALWIAEPQQTVVLQRKLQGFIFNPFEIRTFGFYTMHY